MALGARCVNPVCPRAALPKGPRCGRCRAWWYRHRTEHPGGTLWTRRPVRPTHCLDRDCADCAADQAAYARAQQCVNPSCVMERNARTGARRCGACAAYWAAHHQERPAWMTQPRRVRRPHLPCRVLDCGRPQRARGWCASHYESWRHGRALRVRCHEGACPRAPYAREWCHAHYQARYRARRRMERSA